MKGKQSLFDVLKLNCSERTILLSDLKFYWIQIRK